MNTKTTYLEKYTVYPGEYMPMPETKELLQNLKITGKTHSAILPVNMNELNDCFNIEVGLPGVNREDIFIQIKDHVLSVSVLQKDCLAFKNKNIKLHEIENQCLERHIALPKNSNAEFVSAEFKQGILSLYIPKTAKPSHINNEHIVVY